MKADKKKEAAHRQQNSRTTLKLKHKTSLGVKLLLSIRNHVYPFSANGQQNGKYR